MKDRRQTQTWFELLKPKMNISISYQYICFLQLYIFSACGFVIKICLNFMCCILVAAGYCLTCPTEITKENIYLKIHFRVVLSVNINQGEVCCHRSFSDKGNHENLLSLLVYLPGCSVTQGKIPSLLISCSEWAWWHESRLYLCQAQVVHSSSETLLMSKLDCWSYMQSMAWIERWRSH